MQFLTPGFLWLGLAGLIPVLLYLFRRRSKRINVSTLAFFKTLAREHQESAWLRRIKKWLSFALTLLVLAAAVIALGRPVFRVGEAGQFSTVVILLDRSASMELRDTEGETRLAAAQRILTERLRSVREEVGIALVVYDDRPEIVMPRSRNRRELLSRLGEIEVRPIAGNAAGAMDAAVTLAGLETPSEIWHFSDQLFRESGGRTTDSTDGEEADGSGSESSLPGEIRLRERSLALEGATNVGLTAFQLRPVPLAHGQYDAYVQVSLNASAPSPVSARLTVHVGGLPSQFREIDLAPGEHVGLTFRIAGARDQVLRLAIEYEGDEFALDNQVMMPLPEPKSLVVAWIRSNESEDPYTRLALAAMQEKGSLDLLKGPPEAWPLDVPVDAVVLDGWLPENWPDDVPVIAINPPSASGPIAASALRSSIPYDAVRVGNDSHPILFRVSSGRVAITRTTVFETADSLEPLWIAGSDPVLAAGEYRGQRVVVMGFSPGLSERLPLTAAFPLLMGNALLWCVEEARGDSGSRGQYSTGEFVDVTGDSIRWREWREGEIRERRVSLRSNTIELDRIGVWETGGGEKGTAHLLSAIESDIPGGAGIPGESEYFESSASVAGSLRIWLLAVLAIVLVIESFLFHRLAVY